MLLYMLTELKFYFRTKTYKNPFVETIIEKEDVTDGERFYSFLHKCMLYLTNN